MKYEELMGLFGNIFGDKDKYKEKYSNPAKETIDEMLKKAGLFEEAETGFSEYNKFKEERKQREMNRSVAIYIVADTNGVAYTGMSSELKPNTNGFYEQLVQLVASSKDALSVKLLQEKLLTFWKEIERKASYYPRNITNSMINIHQIGIEQLFPCDINALKGSNDTSIQIISNISDTPMLIQTNKFECRLNPGRIMTFDTRGRESGYLYQYENKGEGFNLASTL